MSACGAVLARVAAYGPGGEAALAHRLGAACAEAGLDPRGTLWALCADRREADGRLAGCPWRLAFALVNAGWLLRQDIALVVGETFEHLFVLARRPDYRFTAPRERGVTRNPGGPQRQTDGTHGGVSNGNRGLNAAKERLRRELAQMGHTTRTRRTVWRGLDPLAEARAIACGPDQEVAVIPLAETPTKND